MNSDEKLLSSGELEQVEQGKALGKDYFYIPVIYYSERSPNDEAIWYSLRFNNDEPPASLMAYASKVSAGQTLWQAVRNDLQKDFNYPHDKSFVIESAKPYDTAKNKYGDDLTRMLVWLGVDEKFNTDNIHPLDMRLRWLEEGEHVFNLVGRYFDEPADSASANGDFTKPTITREELIAAYKPYVDQGIGNPYDIDSQDLTSLDDAYREQQSQLWKTLPFDEQIRSSMADSTIYFDAGFTDLDLLDEIASDWLLNDLSQADNALRRDLANEVKAKMSEVQKRIKELNPDYELTDWDSFGTEWNPSRTAGPGEFYKNYAYWKGQSQATIEGAIAEYKKLHSDADDRVIMGEMKEAAANYKEVA